ncbi:MAG: dihydrofolate reductase family protein [Patescibacteria group bacterium]
MKTIMLAAITLDGRIARGNSELINWTSKEDKEMFTRITKEAGVMVMGSKTYDTFPRPLPGRLHIVMTRDVSGRENIPGQVEFTSKSPQEILDDLVRRGYSLIAITGGAKINSLFLKEGLLDEVWLTMEPTIFGEGVSVFTDPVQDVKLDLIGTEMLNPQSILLKYAVQKKA